MYEIMNCDVLIVPALSVNVSCSNQSDKIPWDAGQQYLYVESKHEFEVAQVPRQ